MKNPRNIYFHKFDANVFFFCFFFVGGGNTPKCINLMVRYYLHLNIDKSIADYFCNI